MAEPGDGGSDGGTPPPSPYGSPPGGQPRKVSPYLDQPPSTGPYDPPSGYPPSGYPPASYPPTSYPPPGYEPPGYEPPGYEPPEYEPSGYEPPEYEDYGPPPSTPSTPPGSPVSPSTPFPPALTASPSPPGLPARASLPAHDPLPVHEPHQARAPEPRREIERHGVRKILHVTGIPVLATLLLAWALTTLVGDVRWGPISVVPPMLACLSPLLVVVTLPVVTAALRRRSWIALVPALAAFGLPWVFVVGYVVPADPPTGELLPLRALLVTARGGIADAQDIAAAAKAQRSDLVVVTELSPTLAHDLTQVGLARSLPPRYVAVPEDGQEAAAGLAIYSRFAVDDVQRISGTHWPAVRARVMVGRTPVTLVTGHVSRPSTDHLDRWRRDLRMFGGAAKIKGPVLVLANFNATPWQPQFRAIVSGRLHDAADVLGRGLRPTWPNFSPLPLLPTDHALVAGAGVSSLATVPITGTDHRALAVELSVPGTP